MSANVGIPVLAVAVLVAASCSGPSNTPSLAPDSLAPSSVRPPVPAGSGFTLSGGIFEVAPDGSRRPLSARNVLVDVQGKGSEWLPVDAHNRYHLANVPSGRFVRITSVGTFGPTRRRLCGTNTTMHGDTQLDAALYLAGAPLPKPTLTGQIFATIDGARVPLSGADVYFRSTALSPDVYDYTDANGQYTLCGIPQLPGELYMICGNDALAHKQPVDIQSDAVIDIDATTFHECLLLVPKS